MTWWPRLTVLHRDRILAYLAVAVAATGFAACAVAGGHLVVVGIAAVVLGLLAALIDGSAGATSLLMAALVIDWLISVRVAESWWSLPAMAFLAVVWAGCALAGSGPHEAPLPPRLLRVWALRTGLLVVGCAAMAAGMLPLVGVGELDTPAVAVLAMLAVAAGVVALSVRRFGTQEPSDRHVD